MRVDPPLGLRQGQGVPRRLRAVAVEQGAQLFLLRRARLPLAAGEVVDAPTLALLTVELGCCLPAAPGGAGCRTGGPGPGGFGGGGGAVDVSGEL